MTEPVTNESDNDSRPAKHNRSATRVVHRGSKFDLRTDRLSLPGGPEVEKDIIEHPGSVVVIPIADDGKVLMIEQWRPAVGKFSIELPSGTRESGESADVTAQRELREEAGVRAGQFERIGGLYPVTGYSTEYCHVYVARSLSRDPLAQDKLEDIRVVPMPVADVWKLIAQNSIDDALTVAAMSLASVSNQDLAPKPTTAQAHRICLSH